MASSHYVITLLVISLVQCYALSDVPVFVWGDLAKNLKNNPLAKVSVPEFEEILDVELKNEPFTVIFMEESLSVEDFSLRNLYGVTSFPYLHSSISKALYLSAVESPLVAIKSLADPDKVDHVKLTEDGLSADIKPENGKFLIVNLKDAQEHETREDLLRRHDSFMQEIINKFKSEHGKVVAIYTAHYPSWTIPSHSRVRRQAVGQNSASLFSVEGLLLYVKGIIVKIDSTSTTMTTLASNSTAMDDKTLNATLTFQDENKLVLNFVSQGGYWMFNTITFSKGTQVPDEELTVTSDVNALLGFSYRCADVVTFSSSNDTKPVTITFQDLKIQPFFDNGTAIPTKFGDSFNCVGFFSAPIWSGLFVVFILLSITFYGIMMMMDIRTMDRFDDPKGKTITINASD